jgi:hypothetical protein
VQVAPDVLAAAAKAAKGKGPAQPPRAPLGAVKQEHGGARQAVITLLDDEDDAAPAAKRTRK